MNHKNNSYLKLYYPFRTNLDDFCSTVSHGKRTGIETRGGREDEQLAHLVHATGKHISKDLSFSCFGNELSLKTIENWREWMQKKVVYQPPLSKSSLITNCDQSFLGREVFHAFPGWRGHNVVYSTPPSIKMNQPWRSDLALSAPLVHLTGDTLSKSTQVWEYCL